MSSWTPDSVPTRTWAIAHELPDTGEVAVFDEERSELVLLNPTAGRAWSLVDGVRTIRDIAVLLAEMSEEPPALELAEEQLSRFFEDMERRGAMGGSDGRP